MPLTRRAALAAAALALPVLPVRASDDALPPEVAIELPGARLQGRGELRWLGLRVYDARLWATSPMSASAWTTTPLALELRYARNLDGRAIAERSLQEMRRQGPLAEEQAGRWLQQMTGIFPDVREGDRITGLKRPGELARFYANGRLAGEVRDADFARLFFGIWLSPQTSQPRLREALLGPEAARG